MFVKPTLEEVRAYCRERANRIDPEAFVDHYESNGWKVGGKAPMKDWRAAIRNWEKHGYGPRNKGDPHEGMREWCEGQDPHERG